jgi:hypothetical protein
MPQVGGLRKFGIIANLAALDLIAGLFLTWLLLDNPRRAPFLFIAVPAVVIANVAIAWWKLRSRAALTLPAIYFFGSVGAVVWTAADFEWWKLLLLPVPVTLFIVNVQRFRRVLASEIKP